MTISPFTLVEMQGMSIVTATWFMFIVAIGTGLVYLVMREFNNIWKRIEKHSDSIGEIRQDMSTIRENVAVTRSVVERIAQKIEEKERK